LKRTAGRALVFALLLAIAPTPGRAEDRPLRQLALAAEARPQVQSCDRVALTRFVKEQIQAWAPKGSRVSVRPWCFIESQSESSRPITGHGAVAYHVTLQRAGAKRSELFACWVAGKTNMKVLAGKNSQGKHEIFGAEGLTLPSRLSQPLCTAKRIAAELVVDEKARAAILTGAAGAAAAPLTKGVSLALIGYAASEVGKSINNGRAAQREALAATAGWVAERAARDGVYPTFDAAYNHYGLELEERGTKSDGKLVGASPWPRTKFYDRLRDLGL
jgi:hypothetical protein